MSIKTMILILLMSPALGAVEWSVMMIPNASIRYQANAKNLPESYTNDFGGNTSPVYRLSVAQASSPRGYWELSFMHAGVFGGGQYGVESVADNVNGGLYQTSHLNIGFEDTAVTFRRPLKGLPLEALFNISVWRSFYTRKDFVVEGDDLRDTGFDYRGELSLEGLGVGLAGRHGDRFFARWQTVMNYYTQLADANTDAAYGQVFQLEGGLGARVWRGLCVEVGGFRQYQFVPGPAYRVATPRDHAAIVAWERQETWTTGLYVRLNYNFSSPPGASASAPDK